MRDGMSFPLHILQAPRGQLKLAARAKNDMAELARIEAEPLGELPEVYRKQPIYYITNRFSVRGTNTTVKWPRYSQVMDYELEFGIVTKNKGANISAAKARDHIFGYTIFNDFSARDAQRIEMEGRLGPAKGKSFDGGNVMGPWIVTPDEIGDPYKLEDGSARQRQDAFAGRDRGHAVLVRGDHRPCHQGRDPDARRIHRLRHGRQWLRPRARLVSRTWRYASSSKSKRSAF